jgi:disulfide bond formation protein DsbB
MAIGTLGIVLFVIGVIILFVWLTNTISNVKYKIFAIFLIALILFTYISFSITIRDQNIDLKTFSGLTTATKLYFSWLASVFGNLKDITTNAIKMDWGTDNSSVR